jgi:hypothetical protein
MFLGALTCSNVCIGQPAVAPGTFTPAPPVVQSSIAEDDLAISESATDAAQADVVFDVPIETASPPEFYIQMRPDGLPYAPQPVSDLLVLCAASVRTNAAGEAGEFAPLPSELSEEERKQFISREKHFGTMYAYGYQRLSVAELSEKPTVVTVTARDVRAGNEISYSGAPYECLTLYLPEIGNRYWSSFGSTQIADWFSVVFDVGVDYAPQATPDSVFHVKGTLP